MHLNSESAEFLLECAVPFLQHGLKKQKQKTKTKVFWHNEKISDAHHQAGSWQSVCWGGQWFVAQNSDSYGKIQVRTYIHVQNWCECYLCPLELRSAAPINCQLNSNKFPCLAWLPGLCRPQCWKGWCVKKSPPPHPPQINQFKNSFLGWG